MTPPKPFLPLLLLILAGTQPVRAANISDLRGAEAKAALDQFETTLKQNPKDYEALKSAGIILHQLSRGAPDKDQVETAERYLKEAQKLKSDDPETAAWLGSTITMKARFETDPGKQTFFVKSGTRMLDKAIQQVPENTVVRLTRAYNSLELPAFLKRTKFAVEDFKFYLELCKTRECPADYVADARLKLAEAEKIVAETK
jgi:tetratricopeptide (TPR) repeat protein